MAKRNTLAKKGARLPIAKDTVIDYKNTSFLKRYLSSYGKIVARKRSGLTAGQQRKIAAEIKRARVMALLPFVHK